MTKGKKYNEKYPHFDGSSLDRTIHLICLQAFEDYFDAKDG